MKGIPAMSPKEVHDYLRELGRAWTGAGMAMEVGCWLGATSAALLEGLVEAGYNKPFWAFDRWCANEAEVRKAAQENVTLVPGQNLRPIYRENITKIYNNVKMIQGRIPDRFRSFKRAPIEICIFDAPKCNPIFIDSVKILEPHFIPGVTVFGLMDYYFYLRRRNGERKPDWEKFLAPVEFIEKHSEHFTMLKDFKDNGSCVFFKYEKPILWK